MPITLGTPIVSTITAYDLANFSIDFSLNRVVIGYVPAGGGPIGTVTMTIAQFDAATGASMRLRMLNALAGPNGLNLTGATVT